MSLFGFRLSLVIFGFSWFIAGIILPLNSAKFSGGPASYIDLLLVVSAVVFFALYAFHLAKFTKRPKVRKSPSAECWVFPFSSVIIILGTILLSNVFNWLGVALLTWLAYFLAVFHTGFVRFLTAKYVETNMRSLVKEVVGMLFVSMFLGYILIKYSKLFPHIEGPVLFIVGMLGLTYSLLFVWVSGADANTN